MLLYTSLIYTTPCHSTLYYTPLYSTTRLAPPVNTFYPFHPIPFPPFTLPILSFLHTQLNLFTHPSTRLDEFFGNEFDSKSFCPRSTHKQMKSWSVGLSYPSHTSPSFSFVILCYEIWINAPNTQDEAKPDYPQRGSPRFRFTERTGLPLVTRGCRSLAYSKSSTIPLLRFRVIGHSASSFEDT